MPRASSQNVANQVRDRTERGNVVQQVVGQSLLCN